MSSFIAAFARQQLHDMEHLQRESTRRRRRRPQPVASPRRTLASRPVRQVFARTWASARPKITW